MLLFIEKKIGKDLSRKIYDFYKDFIHIEIIQYDIRKSKESKDKYQVSGNCCYITHGIYCFICTPRFINQFYRKYINLSNDTLHKIVGYSE